MRTDFLMPFPAVPCFIWLAHDSERDAYGNVTTEHTDEPDVKTTCLYSPGSSIPDTQNDIEDGRPTGVEVDMTFYLPKTLDADLRGALIACYPPDDSAISGRRFEVVGKPYSYPRQAVPGNYSWVVEAAEYLG